MMRLNGKTAIVTGGSRGIGRATVELFLAEGASVVAAAIDAEIEALPTHERLLALRTDVTDEEQVREMVAAAVARFGGLDILFNNAGIEVAGTVTDLTPSGWDRQLDVNLRAVFLCCRHAIPEMLRRGGGSIVNNASINAIRGNTGLAAYCASKGGVAALTRALALDYAAKGIRVNCICPGTIDDTEMVQRKLRSGGEDLRRQFIAKHPMGRLGTALEVAYAVLFLAGDEASFVTGIELTVDGGRSIR